MKKSLVLALREAVTIVIIEGYLVIEQLGVTVVVDLVHFVEADHVKNTINGL
ncbi:hypothetical protein ACK6D9_22050 [Hoeflea sp. Naph1]|uniref:hypothetical protein n=1 Tax=Hoeflea sp. Naph1 TaxID=3388653 RepID=UPI00398F9B8E